MEEAGSRWQLAGVGGALMAAAGGWLLVEVLMEAWSVYQAPNSNRFLTYVQFSLADRQLFSVRGAPMVLGEGGARLAAFGILLGFGQLGVRAGIALIRAGVSLFLGDRRAAVPSQGA